MKDLIAAYSFYKIYTSPIFWICCGLTFLYGFIGEKLTPPKPKPDQTICTEVSCPNPKKAISTVNQLISRNPKDSQLYVSRGSTYCITKQISLCLSDFDVAIKLSPDKADTYMNLGTTLARIDPVRSNEAFDQAIKIYRQHGDTNKAESIRELKSAYAFER
jgi:tetratricopeptide (TPR) repeat protein